MGELKSILVPESHIREHFEGSAQNLIIEDFERVGQRVSRRAGGYANLYSLSCDLVILFILFCIITSSSFIMIHSSPSTLNSMGISTQHW